MRKKGDANAAMVQEELLAREKQVGLLKQQADELKGDEKARAKQFKQERKSAMQAKKETNKRSRSSSESESEGGGVDTAA